MKNKYEKVIKQFLILLALLFVSPIVFSIALKSLNIYKEGILLYLPYILLVLGGGLLIFTVYYGFKTFITLRKTIFDEE